MRACHQDNLRGWGRKKKREGSLWAWLSHDQAASLGVEASANGRLPPGQLQEKGPDQPIRGETSQVGQPRASAPSQFKEVG